MFSPNPAVALDVPSLRCCDHSSEMSLQVRAAKVRQVATDLWTRPISFSQRSTSSGSYISTLIILLLLSPKTNTYFNILQRVKNGVDTSGWLCTEIVYLPADGHTSKY